MDTYPLSRGSTNKRYRCKHCHLGPACRSIQLYCHQSVRMYFTAFGRCSNTRTATNTRSSADRHNHTTNLCCCNRKCGTERFTFRLLVNFAFLQCLGDRRFRTFRNNNRSTSGNTYFQGIKSVWLYLCTFGQRANKYTAANTHTSGSRHSYPANMHGCYGECCTERITFKRNMDCNPKPGRRYNLRIRYNSSDNRYTCRNLYLYRNKFIWLYLFSVNASCD